MSNSRQISVDEGKSAINSTIDGEVRADFVQENTRRFLNKELSRFVIISPKESKTIQRDLKYIQNIENRP